MLNLRGHLMFLRIQAKVPLMACKTLLHCLVYLIPAYLWDHISTPKIQPHWPLCYFSVALHSFWTCCSSAWNTLPQISPHLLYICPQLSLPPGPLHISFPSSVLHCMTVTCHTIYFIYLFNYWLYSFPTHKQHEDRLLSVCPQPYSQLLKQCLAHSRYLVSLCWMNELCTKIRSI